MGKTDPKTRSIAAKTEVSGKVFERVFLPWMAILILSHLVTMYLAPAYMWGVHFYHFYPPPIGWILVLFSLTILIPGVSESLYTKFEALAKKVRKPFGSLSQNKGFLILSLVSLPVFWIFRNRLHLLGDGMFRITDLPEGTLHLQEWLDAFIHLVVYRVMIKLIPGWTPELTYSIISVLCGGVFVFLALKLSALLGKTDLGKALIFFFLISLGSIQLFFGYVESYSVLQVVLLAYILFSAMYLMRKVNIVPTLIAFVVSVGLHVTSLVFAPSFVYLLMRRSKGRTRKRDSATKTASSAITLAALMAACVLIAYWVIMIATGLEKTGKGIFILPLKATVDYPFGMFSLAHLSEFVNQLLLISPLGISLIVFFLLFEIRFNEFKDKLVNFLILGTAFALVYLFAFNFTLGSADWDLRSMPAPFIGLLGILVFLRWAEKPSAVHRPPSADQDRSDVDKPKPEKAPMTGSRIGKRFGAWGVIFIWFSLFHTVPWIMVNAHNQRSVDRYLLIQENDPHPVDEMTYNLYKIERILELAGLPEEVPKMYRRAIDKKPTDPRNYCNLAGYYYEKKDDFHKAIFLLHTALRQDPSYFKANQMMGYLYLQRNESAKALPYLEQAFPFLKGNPNFVYNLGLAYCYTNRPQRALASAQQIIELEPDNPKAYYLLGIVNASMGDLEKARRAWERALAINPGDSLAAQSLEELERHPEK